MLLEKMMLKLILIHLHLIIKIMENKVNIYECIKKEAEGICFFFVIILLHFECLVVQIYIFA